VIAKIDAGVDVRIICSEFQAEQGWLERLQEVGLDAALSFQAEIANVIDPARMVYVAGYDQVTAAAIRDVTQLATDNGYILSKRGNGTDPHDLGLLPGVRTFFVDEEQHKLPANAKVQATMSELL